MRRRRYREPVFSGGFTVFLLLLVLVGCGIVLYLVVSGEAEGRFASLTPPAIHDYGPGEHSIFEGNANLVEAAEPGDYTEDNGDYGYEYIPYEPFVLLTEVDNSLLPWYLKLVNRYNFLDYDFMPELNPIGNGHQFDARAYRALLNMLESANYAGYFPIVVSSFRSVSRQTYLFNRQVQRQIDSGLTPEEAFEAARRVVAYPGSSEHNLGLAVDIVSQSYHGLTARQAEKPEIIWLKENGHRYGFIARYPYYQQHITNIIFEPWHFRYVGVAAATEIFERGLVLEEFVSEILMR